MPNFLRLNFETLAAQALRTTLCGPRRRDVLFAAHCWEEAVTSLHWNTAAIGIGPTEFPITSVRDPIAGLSKHSYLCRMKRGYGLARAVRRMERQELETLPTGALLARLKRLRWCEESRSESDLSDDEIASAAGSILFKEDAAWREAYADLKTILAGREHIDGKP